MPIGPRRIVADVLLMSTFKVGHPVEEFVQMKIDNSAGNAFCRSSRRIHGWPRLYFDGHFNSLDDFCITDHFSERNEAGLSGSAILGSNKAKWAVFR